MVVGAEWKRSLLFPDRLWLLLPPLPEPAAVGEEPAHSISVRAQLAVMLCQTLLLRWALPHFQRRLLAECSQFQMVLFLGSLLLLRPPPPGQEVWFPLMVEHPLVPPG